MKKYLAEFIGTFLLAFSVLVSTGLITRIGTPALAALVLGFCVYTLGMVSGAHLNPAITLAVFSVRKIGVQDALGYIIAQLAGAGLAAANFFFASSVHCAKACLETARTWIGMKPWLMPHSSEHWP